MNFDKCVYPFNHHSDQYIEYFYHPRKFPYLFQVNPLPEATN